LDYGHNPSCGSHATHHRRELGRVNAHLGLHHVVNVRDDDGLSARVERSGDPLGSARRDDDHGSDSEASCQYAATRSSWCAGTQPRTLPDSNHADTQTRNHVDRRTQAFHYAESLVRRQSAPEIDSEFIPHVNCPPLPSHHRNPHHAAPRRVAHTALTPRSSTKKPPGSSTPCPWPCARGSSGCPSTRPAW
jgi:hypothetical protein